MDVLACWRAGVLARWTCAVCSGGLCIVARVFVTGRTAQPGEGEGREEADGRA